METKLETGKELANGGCNAYGKPDFEGQEIKFVSPYHPDVILTDVAKRDRYGHLKWVAKL